MSGRWPDRHIVFRTGQSNCVCKAAVQVSALLRSFRVPQSGSTAEAITHKKDYPFPTKDPPSVPYRRRVSDTPGFSLNSHSMRVPKGGHLKFSTGVGGPSPGIGARFNLSTGFEGGGGNLGGVCETRPLYT
eukprot:gene10566-biopygen9583